MTPATSGGSASKYRSVLTISAFVSVGGAGPLEPEGSPYIRSWSTLPAKRFVSQSPLTPGTVPVQLNCQQATNCQFGGSIGGVESYSASHKPCCASWSEPVSPCGSRNHRPL